MKKINSHSYFSTKISLNKPHKMLENGCLYSNKGGRLYPTKISPDDLPESFIEYCVWGDARYIDAANVKGIIYKPNYVFNHVYKDDLLIVSYSKPITVREPDLDNKFEMFSERVEPCEIMLWGNVLPEFAEAVKKYSGIDTSEIIKEMKLKEKWYYDADGNPIPDFKKNKTYFVANL